MSTTVMQKIWEKIHSTCLILYIPLIVLLIIQPIIQLPWLSGLLMGIFAVVITVGSIVSWFMAKSNDVLVVGKLVSLRQFGVFYIGNIPYCALTVQFFTQDRQQITATKKMLLIDMARFQIGILLPLRYNPQNPAKITIEFNADPKAVQQATYQYHMASEQATQENDL